MAVFIARNGNFSENKIGTIEVPIVYEAETLAYKEAIPTAASSFDYARNLALNNFFKGLKENSLLSKITRNYLPIFGQTEGAINLVNPSDTPLNLPTTNATYNSRGMTISQSFLTNFVQDWTQFHLGFYNLDGRPESDGDIMSTTIAATYTDLRVGRRVKGVNNSGINVTPVDYSLLSGYSFSSGSVLTGKTNTVWQSYINGEYPAEITWSGNTIAGNNPIIGGVDDASSSEIPGHPISFLTFGDSALTQSDFIIYGSLIENLMQAFDL